MPEECKRRGKPPRNVGDTEGTERAEEGREGNNDRCHYWQHIDKLSPPSRRRRREEGGRGEESWHGELKCKNDRRHFFINAPR